MKKRLIHILLLCSLFFNIAHATVIALEDDCHHDSVSEYILDNSHVDDDCGDLCELHHMFHFMAILSSSVLSVESAEHSQVSTLKISRYTPPFKQTQIKPPIA